MKDDAVIINTARGALIDEPGADRGAEQGRLFAFLDVTEPEPPAADSPLRRLPNVVVTPHLAGCIHDCSAHGRDWRWRSCAASSPANRRSFPSRRINSGGSREWQPEMERG
jgi:hypothetical protein